MKEENVKMGKVMFEAEAKRRGFSTSQLLNDDAFAHVAAKFSFTGQDEMFASIGYGAITVNHVIVKLIDHYRRSQPQQEIAKSFAADSKSSGGVKVKGMAGLLVRFAGCCNPVPGDEIVGFISRGYGVTVHRKDCPNLKNVDADRLIEVSWSDEVKSVYNASIKVVGNTQAEILAIVATCVSKFGLDIVSTNGRMDHKTKQTVVDFNIRLNSKEELENLIVKLKQDSKIIDVFRTAN
jgi:GTP pyrophosphokinase